MELIEILEVLKLQVKTASRDDLLALVTLALSRAGEPESPDEKKVTVEDLVTIAIGREFKTVEAVKRRVFDILRDGMIDRIILGKFLAEDIEIVGEGNIFAHDIGQILKPSVRVRVNSELLR